MHDKRYNASYEEGSVANSHWDVEEQGAVASFFCVFLLLKKKDTRHGDNIDASGVVLFDPDDVWARTGQNPTIFVRFKI